MVNSDELDDGTCCRRYVPPAIQLRGSPSVSWTFAVKSPVETMSMFDSIAILKCRMAPDVPSTGPVVVAYWKVCGPERGNGTFSDVTTGASGDVEVVGDADGRVDGVTAECSKAGCSTRTAVWSGPSPDDAASGEP